MRRGNISWSPLLVVSGLLTAVGAGSCSSSKTSEVGLADGCSLNSDCNDPLVCIFSLCHEQCTTTRDCPEPQICVAAGAYKVCTLPGESCEDGGTCPVGLLCGSDQQCHDPCTTSADCTVTGQVCSSDRTCVDSPDGGSPDGGNPGDGSGSSSGGDGSRGDGSDGASESSTDAPYVPGDAGGALGFVASNLPPKYVPTSLVDAGDAGAPAVSVTGTCTNCLGVTPVTIMQNDGSPADLYVLGSLSVTTTATLDLTGPNVIILAVLGDVNIYGIVSVTANDSVATAGGFSAGVNLGPGGGTVGAGEYANSGGGGASYCGTGGAGYAPSGMAATAGMPYGNATLTPLLGGSAGGGPESLLEGGGGGGGIQIVSATSITVGPEGAITAGGGGGNPGNAAGGGSGGAILLEAPTVTIRGALAANGGGGGPGGDNASPNGQPATGGIDGMGELTGGAGSAGATTTGTGGVTNSDKSPGGGGGGAGWIRVNTASGSASITGVVSPATTTSCFSQGTLGG